MFSTILNPLIQTIGFITLWYLYTNLAKVKIPIRYLALIYLSYVTSASYFGLVKIVVDPLFFLILDLALVKNRSIFHRLLYAFYPTILLDVSVRFTSIIVFPHLFHLPIATTESNGYLILSYLVAPLVIYFFLKIFSVDFKSFYLLKEDYIKKNWVRSTGILSFYYVFFTVIHGLNNLLPQNNDPHNLFETVFRGNSNRFLFMALYLILLLWDFYNWNHALRSQFLEQLETEKNLLVDSMSNYNKALTQILKEKETASNLFHKELSTVASALDAEDYNKATYLLESYQADRNLKVDPQAQEQLNRIANPIMASFLANRLLELEKAKVNYSLNISPYFASAAISDSDLYQLALNSFNMTRQSLKPDSTMNITYLQLDDSQVLLYEYPSDSQNAHKDTSFTEFIKSLPNVEYRTNYRSGLLSQIIIIHDQNVT